ncbi:ATP-binding protein [Streptomyces sp. NPDC056387]|uniref:ATP-binding protein n=1 Tax=Streptomyces sp. NPDC056387 TaxID=3345803 RepID=UPI0035DF720D
MPRVPPRWRCHPSRWQTSDGLPPPRRRRLNLRWSRPARPNPRCWGEVVGDDAVAAAMIDRLVHHAEVISLKGDSYRMRGRDLGRVPPANTGE